MTKNDRSSSPPTPTAPNNPDKRSKYTTDEQTTMEKASFVDVETQTDTNLISKVSIYESLAQILGSNPSRHTLVSLYTGDESEVKDVIIVGRPEVYGSSSRQMRHVIPFSFVEAIIEGSTTSGLSYQLEAKLDVLSKNINMFLPKKSGIRINNQEFKLLEEWLETSIISHEIFTKNSSNKSYLISTDALPDEWMQKINWSAKEVEVMEEKYSKSIQKLITYSIQRLRESISDNDINANTIMCEALSESILTLYNKMENVSFAAEGNTLPYEIRLYSSPEEAQKLTKTNNYNIVSSDHIEKLVVDGENLNSRIRICNNEGVKTKHVLEALKLLNNIIGNKVIDEPQDSNIIEQYNKKSKLKLLELKIDSTDKTMNLNEYTADLDINPSDATCASHIARYMYLVFDLKPLENSVFVPKENSPDSIDTYENASTAKITKFSIMNGEEYRKQPTVQTVGRETNNKLLRPQNESSEHKKLLISKVIEYTKICAMAFENFLSNGEQENYSKSILNKFVDLIDWAYSPITYKVDILQEIAGDTFFIDSNSSAVSSNITGETPALYE